MKFRTKLFLLNSLPLLLFAMVSLLLGITQFRSSLYEEKEGNLRSTALAALTMYSSQGYGDYQRREDGHVWRGMNLNISEKASIVDGLKKQTGVDITFYFGNTAVMTSVRDENDRRCFGLAADEAIREYTLQQGKQLWCRRLTVNGKLCQAYVIPIRQESDDTVVGALMASKPADDFYADISQYILTTVAVMVVVLGAVLIFIRWHVGWFAQKFSEVADRSRLDLLTGIFNKLTFEGEVKSRLKKQEQGQYAVLMLFDMDDFKQVNDRFGHQAGDEVLKAFAEILSHSFRNYDIVGRIGGDEFMVFMSGMTEETLPHSEELARRVMDALKALEIGEVRDLTCSIGIGTDDGHADFDSLYALADKALYAAKQKGKANFFRCASSDPL